MELKIDEYLNDIPNCSWANSGKYFSDDKVLHAIGFIGVGDTDTFIQTSFTIGSRLSISGAQIKTFAHDNTQHENFIVYCLSLPQPISQNAVKITLRDPGLFSVVTLKKIIYGVPIVALVVLNLLTFILPGPLRNVLLYINLAAILSILFFYVYKGVPILISLFREKKYFIDERKIRYLDPRDATILTEQHVEALAPLADENVTSAVLFKERIFLKQPINESFHPQAEVLKSRFFNVINSITSDVFQNNFS
jgi:hypothetical protein